MNTSLYISLLVKINNSIQQCEESIIENPNMLNSQKSYIITGIHEAAFSLIKFAKLARKSESIGFGLESPAISEMGRPVTNGAKNSVYSTAETYIHAGQAFASLLSSWGLDGKIVELIEYAYGVSFRLLKMHKSVKHKETGKEAYILFDGRSFNRNSMSLAIDGNFVGMNIEDFKATYYDK